MTDGIDMSKYLLRNERWLDTGEDHKVDGTLTDDEVAVFFSNGHLQYDGDNYNVDGTISNEEFNKWYEANESAISSFLSAEYNLSYSDSKSKQSVYEAIQDLAKNYLNDEYKNTNHGKMEIVDENLKVQTYDNAKNNFNDSNLTLKGSTGDNAKVDITKLEFEKFTVSAPPAGTGTIPATTTPEGTPETTNPDTIINPNGTKTETTTNADGTITEKTYNANGIVTHELVKNSRGNTLSNTFYSVDAKGNRVMTSQTVNTFDDGGKAATNTVTMYSDGKKSKETFTDFKNGNIVKETEYYSDGKKKSYSESDPAAHTAKKTYYASDGSSITKTEEITTINNTPEATTKHIKITYSNGNVEYKVQSTFRGQTTEYETNEDWVKLENANNIDPNKTVENLQEKNGFTADRISGIFETASDADLVYIIDKYGLSAFVDSMNYLSTSVNPEVEKYKKDMVDAFMRQANSDGKYKTKAIELLCECLSYDYSSSNSGSYADCELTQRIFASNDANLIRNIALQYKKTTGYSINCIVDKSAAADKITYALLMKQPVTDAALEVLVDQIDTYNPSSINKLFGEGSVFRLYATDPKTTAAFVRKFNENKKTSLINFIDLETDKEISTPAETYIAKQLLAAAKKGDPTAIEYLCKEIYSATKGRSGTSDSFINAIFKVENADVIEKLQENYSTYYGRKLFDDVLADADSSQTNAIHDVEDEIAGYYRKK